MILGTIGFRHEGPRSWPEEVAQSCRGEVESAPEVALDRIPELLGESERSSQPTRLSLAACDRQVETLTAPHAKALTQLDTIPGVARRTAEVIAAELGCDMTRFPTAGHAASWTGLCPGNHESAGKRLSGRTRLANRTLRQALVESARGAVRKRDSYLAAQYRRLVKRRGDKKAIVAVAHSILVIAYHVLRDGQPYRELGGDYFERLNAERLTRYHTKRLAALGYAVTLTKHAA